MIWVNYATSQKTKLRDVAIDHIRQTIRDQNLGVGDSLPTERQLGESLNVSRTVVREALAGLEMRGLLALSPGRPPLIVAEYDKAVGKTLEIVIADDPQALMDLTETRQIIEVELAALAAVRCRADDLIRLHAAHEAMGQSISEVDGYVAADLAFHEALLQAVHNQVLSTLFRPVAELLQASRVKTAWRRRPATEAWQEHQKILECIEARDPHGARRAMFDHMVSTRLDLAAALSTDASRFSS